AHVARNELLALLHPLVEAVADRYAKSGLGRHSLIEAGSEGLATALVHYRATGAYKFSAYATWWIRTRIHQRLGVPVD
ncbi:MAG: hypothetical protein M3R02_19870, partial [Chloroflexota bacterium]|nr:hypothetical protein [Chloroflexota bacterium]